MTLTRAARGTLLILPLALLACAPEEPEVEEAPAPQPISQAGANAMRNAYVDSYMRKDAAGASAFYADDAVMYAPDGTVFTGKPAIQEALNGMIAAGRDSLAMVSQSFEATGDLATDRGTWIMRTLDPQTKEATRQSGGYIMVIGRQPDGTYKVIKDSVWATGAPQ
jgi:ketosteroid isomerase-like protein